jgi:UDP-N-acetylglucosamine--N-acetylmuramyl-(pentapeptide) pyrophosphoryl-undecaprenol N-acetylglucosamine transferase
MKIVIATGGTGGHIFPALQTASVLRDRGHQVIFIGSLGLGEDKVRSEGFEATVLSAKGLTNKSLIGIFKFIFLMLQAVGKSMKSLIKNRPDKVIGFGGYGSFPVVFSAFLLHIPTMIHEQNVVPGKANRLLSKLVKKIAISFPETQHHLNPKKTVWTGCPCHQTKSLETREHLLKKFGLEPNRKTILVLGGSQGSQKINEVFFDMMSSWEGVPIQAIHMTGKKEYHVYTAKYQAASLPVNAVGFISPIEEAYAVSDVVVARSGAATVSEVGFFSIPTIFIPYPLADGHQTYNAQVLSSLGLAQIIEQKDLTKDTFKNVLKILLTLPFDRDAWQKETHASFKEFPAKELALAVENL